MSSAIRLLLAVLLVAGVSGCSGDDTPKSPRADSPTKAPSKVLTKGTCWDDARLPDALGEAAFDDWAEKYAGGDSALSGSMRDDVAFSKSIDCSEPHSLELHDVVSVQPALTRQVTKYADLLDQKSALYRKISEQVSERCLARSPYGRAQRKAGGVDVQLSPWLNTDSGPHVAWDPFPADLWEKGQHRFVCTFEQDKPGTLRFADLTTREVPVTSRACLNTPRKDRPCSGKHQAEVIAGMTLNAAIAKGQISGRKAIRTGADGKYVALSEAQYAKLDKVCQTLFTMVSTVRGGVVGRAYPGTASQWPTKTGDYVASCFALKPYEPPPMISGTVFNRR
ncbi:MAG: hypothetical protein ABIR34_13005 [Marmoricola sp.]